MERVTTALDFFRGTFSLDPLRFFQQLYVPNMVRDDAERSISERLGEKPDGIFILRDVSRAPYLLPQGRTLIYTVSYWNSVSERFNHLFICSDDAKLNWSVLVDVDEFQSYPSLRDILNDVPSIRRTSMKNALVKRDSTKRRISVDPGPSSSERKKKQKTRHPIHIVS